MYKYSLNFNISIYDESNMLEDISNTTSEGIILLKYLMLNNFFIMLAISVIPKERYIQTLIKLINIVIDSTRSINLP